MNHDRGQRYSCLNAHYFVVIKIKITRAKTENTTDFKIQTGVSITQI